MNIIDYKLLINIKGGFITPFSIIKNAFRNLKIKIEMILLYK